MSGWQFSFPPSRTCLWDSTPLDSPCELYLTRNSWLHIRISVATLQLAVRHAKQSRRKIFDCFLIATAWVTEGEGIALEVDRFDPGRPLSGGSGLSPTTLIPGDVPIPSQIAVKSHPDAKHLPHNLETLRQSIATVKQTLASHTSTLDPSLILSLRIHCSCSEDGSLDVECACVYPGVVVEATPIQPISIVQTALARNLSGPLSLSAIQGKTKHGYVTMEASRKLVLLLHSDPKAATLPLVGVWVSGVSSIYHPVVWMACVMYAHSTTLTDRVWGEGGSLVTLVYLQGSTTPLFSQCMLKGGGRVDEYVELANGETSQPETSISAVLSFDLYPAQESTALYTLLETVATRSEDTSSGQQTSMTHDLMPLPSPQPTPTQVPPKLARDSDLSMVSCLSLSDEGQSSVVLTPHTSPVTACTSHDSSRQLQENKENTPVDHPVSGGSNEGTPTNQPLTSSRSQSEESLIVFPDKLGVQMTPRSVDTRRLLKQQEIQLRALQEQVNTLLQAQSPASQSLNTTPKMEASTSTGESLYWPNHSSTPSQPSLFTPSRSTHSTPSQPHTRTSMEREESMCSSIVSGLSVETATSTLSHNVSDMHVDLQSYAQSPSQSHSFGDSASMVGEPLHRDPQQLYQNMLSTVNALLDYQDNDAPSSEQASSIPDTSTHHSIVSNPEQQEIPPHSFASSISSQSVSQYSSHSSYNIQNVQSLNELSNLSNSTTQSSHVSHTSSTLSHQEPSIELPYLHPDVLQQHYSTEISLLPVPRIVGPIPNNNSTLDTAAVYSRCMTSSDTTLDENMQLADMIAMKYLGTVGPQDTRYRSRQPLLAQGDDSVLDTDSAHMSMATQQYLQRHHLLASNGSKPPHNTLYKEATPVQDSQDNILNIKRLKQLPKLI